MALPPYEAAQSHRPHGEAPPVPGEGRFPPSEREELKIKD